jgi:hypothetical protein
MSSSNFLKNGLLFGADEDFGGGESGGGGVGSEARLPSSVRGPVECWAFAWLARIWAGLVMVLSFLDGLEEDVVVLLASLDNMGRGVCFALNCKVIGFTAPIRRDEC